MARNLTMARNIAKGIRQLSLRTKTIYGGSDFSPVDYQVPNFAPSQLTRLVDELEAVLASVPT
jgi:hypothetical protein